MKKISSNIIIFLLVTTFFWGGVNFNFVKKAHAQGSNAPATSISAPVGGGIPTVGTPASTAVSKPSKWSLGTIIAKGADLYFGIMNAKQFGVVSLVLLTISSICGIVLSIQAGIFDVLLMISMKQFGSIIDSSGIVTAWTIIRNLINVSFIFIILYIAISIILGSFGPKKKSTVAGVVISALLINYSMFITRVIIDFGNIIATAIYNTPSGAFSTLGVMTVLQLQTILTPDNLLASGQTNSIVLMILQIVMVCTFIAVLFRGTLFMLGRLIALLALIALSPIGFVGFGIPWLKDKSDEWWTTLVGQVFLLPVFLFFLMMTNTMLKASQSIVGLFNNVSITDGSSVSALQPGQWVYFGLIIGMLHLSTKITKSMAGKTMSDLVDKAAKGMKFAAAAAIAVGASVVTGGAAAAPMAARLAGMAAKGGTTGMVGRVGGAVMSKGASVAKVFEKPGLVGDLSRNLLKNTLGAVKDHTGLDIEAANKSVKEYQKNYNKFAGDEANRVGPSSTEEKITRKEDTMQNINNQAENQMSQEAGGKELVKALKNFSEKGEDMAKGIEKMKGAVMAETDTVKKTRLQKDLTEKEKEYADLSEKNEDAKKARAIKAKAIGEEMGYDTETHENEIEELKKVRIEKQADLNKYLRELSQKGAAGKKAAEILRAVKGKYKEKSDAEKLIDDIKKQAEKDAKATANPTT